MKHIVTVVGARPQFIKAAAVSRAIAKTTGLRETIVHTGQHYDANMSAVFFRDLEIPAPAINLDIGSGSHGEQTGRMLTGLETAFVNLKPDCVLVYGDTNSTLAAALAASKLQIPVAHVEAGLRSFNRSMPEEINRVVTDHLSELLFCPTANAVTLLKKEGLTGSKVHRVGDVMFDAFRFSQQKAQEKSAWFTSLGIEKKNYVLATVHRAENTDNLPRLTAVLAALSEIAKTTPVLLPLHPRTRALVANEQKLSMLLSKIKVIEPVGYLEMILLESNAKIIATDSGGVQKEAFFAGVPCVTLRDETEWVELVKAGWNKLAPPRSASSVLSKLKAALKTSARLSKRKKQNLYGDGAAAVRIAKALKSL